MPDLKISQLIDGGAAQATDEFVVARAGTNNKITTANVTSLINASATQSGSALVNQADIGSAPNEIPLNQYLGTMAYQDANAVSIASASVDALTAGAATVTGVTTTSAGTVSAPALTTSGDTNTGIFYPAADTVALTAGGVEVMRGTSTVLTSALPIRVNAGRTVYSNSLGAISSSGTIVFTFAFESSANARAGLITLSFVGRAASNTVTTAPACEYIGQVHKTTADVVTFNGATTLFEYQFVRATHLAFASTGSGAFTLTLTNPGGALTTGFYTVQLMGQTLSLTSVTTT